jgi:tetratricopeptide (TPR) repeat protein
LFVVLALFVVTGALARLTAAAEAQAAKPEQANVEADTGIGEEADRKDLVQARYVTDDEGNRFLEITYPDGRLERLDKADVRVGYHGPLEGPVVMQITHRDGRMIDIELVKKIDSVRYGKLLKGVKRAPAAFSPPKPKPPAWAKHQEAARKHSKQGDMSRAVEEYAKAAALARGTEDEVRLLLGLTWMMIDAGHPGATEQLKEAVGLARAQGLLEPGSGSDAAFRVARTSAHAGLHRQALEYARIALTNVHGLRDIEGPADLLARSAQEIGRLRSELKALWAVLEGKGKPDEVYAALTQLQAYAALYSIHMGPLREDEKALRKAMARLEPFVPKEHPVGLKVHALLELEAGSTRKAIKAFEKWIARDPEEANENRVMAAILLYGAGKHAIAAEWVREAAEALDPDTSEHHSQMALAAEMAGDRKLSHTHTLRSIELTTDKKARSRKRFEYAEQLSMRGFTAEAIAYLEEIPDDPETKFEKKRARQRLMELYEQEGMTEKLEALEATEKEQADD